LRISKSGFMQWEFCPRAYKYTYIDGMKIAPTVSMQLGSSFHSFADQFFTGVNYNALYEVENKYQVTEIFSEMASKIEVPATLQKDINNFMEFEVDRFWNIHESSEIYDDPVRYYTPVFVEEYMKVRDPFEGYEDIILSGILDRGDLTVNDTIALLEYKRTPNLNKQRLQKELLFYSILYEKAGKYEYPVTDLIAYTPVTNDYLWIEMDKKKQAHVEKRIKLMIEDDKFPCKENLFCSNCVGAELCLNSTVNVDVILEFLQENPAAYTTTEITKELNIRRTLVKAALSDLHIDGKVKKSFKGKTAYWWIE